MKLGFFGQHPTSGRRPVPAQKSFTDLLGPYQPDTDEVSGRFIVRRGGTTTVTTAHGTFTNQNYRVLWSFDKDYKARAAFEFWKQEMLNP